MNLRHTCLILALVLGMGSFEALAQRGKSRKSSRSFRAKKLLVQNKLKKIKKLYRTGHITVKDLWQEINQIELDPSTKLSSSDKNVIAQLKANLFFTDRYYLLALMQATQVLKAARDPYAKKWRSLWEIVHRASQKVSAQYLVEELARTIKLGDKLPPFYGNDWYYILGNSYLSKNQKAKALKFFRRVSLKSKYFIASRYQISLIHLEQKDPKNAEIALKTIISQYEKKGDDLSADERTILDYAYMAMARLHYEYQNFLYSVRFYRKIPKSSPLYYEALFEQSWSLFLSGNTNHALGSLYGVGSSFFKDEFNPEAEILEAIVYFWLCRYDESRYALVRFMTKHEDAVAGLDSFLQSIRLNNERAFQLFEDLISGVTSESLGIRRNVLLTAANKDTMLRVRNQYVSVMEERNRLRAKGVFGSQTGTSAELRRLDKIETFLRNELGKVYKDELIALNDQYKEFHGQAQFLQLELLMSEKEQILGRELHSGSKVYTKKFKDNIRNWGDGSQSWEEKKGEFWWDEIGFHIVKAESKCIAD